MKTSEHFLKGVLLVAAAGILWGGMGTSVQHLYALDIGFTPLGLVTVSYTHLTLPTTSRV